MTKEKQVSRASNRNDKISWNRKMKNMQDLIKKLEPIEAKILEITRKEKYPIMDEIAELRETMVKECIHPEEYLNTNADGTVTCKFCNKKISVNA